MYVLYSQKDHNLYTGYTDDLRRRLAQHNEGKSIATKSRLPLELIYYEAYKDKRDATAREYFLKSGSGRGYLKKLLVYSVPKISQGGGAD